MVLVLEIVLLSFIPGTQRKDSSQAMFHWNMAEGIINLQDPIGGKKPRQ